MLTEQTTLRKPGMAPFVAEPHFPSHGRSLALAEAMPLPSGRTSHPILRSRREVLQHYLGDVIYGANDGIVTTFAERISTLSKGELPERRRHVIPGHQVVGTIEARGDRLTLFLPGACVGTPWLHRTCGNCRYCSRGAENLCENAEFTGYTTNGGELIPPALRALDKAATLVLGGIHMSDIPSFPYDLLYHKRVIRGVANNTGQDGNDFLKLAVSIPVRTRVEVYPLMDANRALQFSRMTFCAVLPCLRFDDPGSPCTPVRH